MRRKQYLLFFPAILIAALIFYFDNLMPLGVAGGVPYVLLVLLGLGLPEKRYVFILATIGTTLTFIGYFTSPVGGIEWVVLTNRFLALFVIWVTAFLVFKQKIENEKLLKNKALLESHITHTPMAVITWDNNFCVNSWNSAAEKIFGYSFEEAKGRHAKELILPEFAISRADKIWHKLKENKGGRRNSNYYITKDEKTISCEWYNTTLTDKNGEFSGVASLVMDITKRVEAEKKIVQEKNTAQSYLDTTQIMLIVLDEQGTITLINNKGCEMLGFEEEELVGNNWFDTCIPFGIHNEVKGVFSSIINGKREGINEYENVVMTKDKKILTFHFLNNYLKDDDNNIIGCIFSAYDVTELNQMQNKLIAAKESAESANKAKSYFISQMSHELRTPLNAILGFSQLLKIREINPEQKESVEEIIKAGDHLLELINEILHLSKIEAGKLDIDMKDVDFLKVINECIALITPLADDRNIDISNEINDNNGIFIEADERRFKEVIINLLSNAVKYNSVQGCISVSSKIIGNERVRITVSDTGEGLDDEQIKNLFKPFERLTSNPQEIEGTGIGLVVCKKLTELMNGTIGVNSTLAKGSDFWIELKISRQFSIAN